MQISTPAEIFAARTALGLSREDLSQLTGFTAAEIKDFEHVRSLAVPMPIVDKLTKLATLQEQLIGALINDIAVVTFWSASDFENHGIGMDRLALP